MSMKSKLTISKLHIAKTQRVWDRKCTNKRYKKKEQNNPYEIFVNF